MRENFDWQTGLWRLSGRREVGHWLDNKQWEIRTD